MIKIPVLGVPFEIQYVNKINEEDDSYGECDGPAHKIKIKKSLTNEQKRLTVFHEILHAALYISGQSELLTEQQEEAIVVALENGLSQLYNLKEEYAHKS